MNKYNLENYYNGQIIQMIINDLYNTNNYKDILFVRLEAIISIHSTIVCCA